MNPRKVTDSVYVCKCWHPIHLPIDGKPEKCPACGAALNWEKITKEKE